MFGLLGCYAKRVAPRRYQQLCSVARALDVVGERWTLLIVRNLSVGPRRYSQLLEELPGLTTNLLAQRLRELQEHGLLAPVSGVGSAGGHKRNVEGYELTELGRALVPAIQALGDFGERLPIPQGVLSGSPQALLAGLQRRYRPGIFEGRVSLTLGSRSVTLLATPEALQIREACDETDPTLSLSAPPGVVVRLFLMDEPLKTIPKESYSLRGRRTDLKRLLRAFQR